MQFAWQPINVFACRARLHSNRQARADAEAAAEERLRLELAQQALKYERRVQELEVAGCGPGLLAAGCTSPARGPGGGGVLDYIPRAEHARILDARLAAKEADAAAQLSTRLAQVWLARGGAADAGQLLRQGGRAGGAPAAQLPANGLACCRPTLCRRSASGSGSWRRASRRPPAWAPAFASWRPTLRR